MSFSVSAFGTSERTNTPYFVTLPSFVGKPPKSRALTSPSRGQALKFVMLKLTRYSV
jgi:hypothetical protein